MLTSALSCMETRYALSWAKSALLCACAFVAYPCTKLQQSVLHGARLALCTCAAVALQAWGVQHHEISELIEFCFYT
jgi:hypothetical protein